MLYIVKLLIIVIPWFIPCFIPCFSHVSLPSPQFPGHLPLQLQLGLAAEGRQRCAAQLGREERQQCHGQGKQPGCHGCHRDRATCWSAARKVQRYRKNGRKHVTVGGWATPLKNMKVSWDDYSQYMQTTNQVRSCKWSKYCTWWGKDNLTSGKRTWDSWKLKGYQ